MSMSHFGPTVALSVIACGIAQMSAAVLPAPCAASAAKRFLRSPSMAALPPPAVGVIGATPNNRPGGVAASPAFAENIVASNFNPELSDIVAVTMFSIFELSACSLEYGYITLNRRGCRIAALGTTSDRAGAGSPSAIHAPACAGFTTRPGTRCTAIPSIVILSPREMTSAAADSEVTD